MPIDSARREHLVEALDAINDMKIPEHLQEAALEYLLGSGVGAAAISAPRRRGAGDGAANGQDLRAFVAAAAPKGAVSEIPCLLYWARENEGKDVANEREVVELYRRAGIRPPKDVAQSFRDLSSKKYMRLESVEGQRGFVRLSRAGEDFVLHDLNPAGAKGQ